jgi:hypothetical protein
MRRRVGGEEIKRGNESQRIAAEHSDISLWTYSELLYTTRLVPDIVGLWSADAPLDRLAELLFTATKYTPLNT